MGCADSLDINQGECHDGIDMTLVEAVITLIGAQIINFGILEVFCRSHGQHLVAILFGEELALSVQQLQCVPLPWVM